MLNCKLFPTLVRGSAPHSGARQQVPELERKLLGLEVVRHEWHHSSKALYPPNQRMWSQRGQFLPIYLWRPRCLYHQARPMVLKIRWNGHSVNASKITDTVRVGCLTELTCWWYFRKRGNFKEVALTGGYGSLGPAILTLKRFHSYSLSLLPVPCDEPFHTLLLPCCSALWPRSNGSKNWGLETWKPWYTIHIYSSILLTSGILS